MRTQKYKFIVEILFILLVLFFIYWEILYFLLNMAIKSKLSDLGFPTSHIKIEHIKDNIYELKNPPSSSDGKQQLKYWKIKTSGMYHVFQYAVPLE